MTNATQRSIGVLIAVAILPAGCGELGFRNRVIGRALAPGGNLVAVCQEVPVFDGPGYALWLETPDGRVLGDPVTFGDADPCDELAWSPDGRVFAVLTGHVARVRFADVEADGMARWRQIDLSQDAAHVRGRDLRFVGAAVVELAVCKSRPGIAACVSDHKAVQIRVPEVHASAG